MVYSRATMKTMDKHKTCSKCSRRKPLREFPKLGGATCRKCKSDYFKEWHTKNVGRQKKNVARWMKIRVAESNKLLNELKSKPCVDCGRSFPPYAMDYDHRDGAQKVRNVSMLRSSPRETILAEVAKCDLVCAVCHRIR